MNVACADRYAGHCKSAPPNDKKIPRGAYKSSPNSHQTSKPASTKLQRASLNSFGVMLILASTTNATTSSCRCLYDQPCWPNESEFPALATQLSRPILHPLPSPLFWTNQERCSSRMKHTILFKNKGRPIVGGLDGNGSISGRMGDGWGSEYPFS